ncbi:ribosomal protein S18-alanine N-acetyltransferase [Shewanella salipaludis]|uniref:[Ribosomal protein bS18]-alanine N-acetyltransferase n=1 Tax=Shewanella salipaludis TaxID=2723052 RepID=A0A972FXR4_9GAMM|nr:ribosomal protein S18-alanine N-acetyltransferase [Shewanella salipaludis]NMH67159.1 ribosomal protein S18-alanine N-acetyltransferase [Shewanella salipaludis]
MSLILVPLTPADVDKMAQIEAQAHSHPWSEANLATCFGSLYRVLGAFHDESLVGFAIVQQIVDELSLLDICIAPEQQGKGLGRLLLKAVIEQAIQSQAVVILLEVRASNVAAQRLYLSSGFVESGRRKGYYQSDTGHEDAILMDLRLEQC